MSMRKRKVNELFENLDQLKNVDIGFELVLIPLIDIDSS